MQTYSLELDLVLEEEVVVVKEAVLLSAFALCQVSVAEEVDSRH